MTFPMIAELITQHAEDASFLWLLRDHAVRQPHYSLTNLAALDQRVEAHLDGLRVAAEPAWKIVETSLLEIGEPGEVFAASVLAFEGGDEAKVEEALNAGTASPEAMRGLVSALGWLDRDAASQHFRALYNAADPLLKRVGIAASAIHRINPGISALQEAFASEDAILKARAFRAVGELGMVDAHITLRANLKAKDKTVRFWAAWSNALLNGHKDAVAYLQQVAEIGGPFARRSAQMAMRRLPTRDGKLWLLRLVKELRQIRVALAAAGAMGDPDVVPFLIDQMKTPSMARAAGESLSLITGVNLAYDKLEGLKPEGFEAGPTEDPEDENVSLDPDDNLSWPDPALVQKWWTSKQHRFSKGTRYLLGQPISLESTRQALKLGYQRQRGAAAIELAILQPGRALFNIHAPGFQQQRLLP